MTISLKPASLNNYQKGTVLDTVNDFDKNVKKAVIQDNVVSKDKTFSSDKFMAVINQLTEGSTFIDDGLVTTTNAWSASKTNTELESKLDISLYLEDKEEIDNNFLVVNTNITSLQNLTAQNTIAISGKVNIADLATEISTLNSSISSKADKTYVDNKLDEKVNTVDLATEISTLNSSISNKADITYVDNKLTEKVDTSLLNDALNLKADVGVSYTKAETNDLLNLKLNISSFNDTLDTINGNFNSVNSNLSLKANSSDVYNKTEIDAGLALKANIADVYNKAEVDTNLALKANIADVYTKTEIDNKAPKIFVIIDPTTADIVIPSASFLDYPIPNTAENGYFSIASNIITFSRAGRYIIEGDMKYVRSANVTGQYIYTTLRNGANGYPLTYSTNFRYLGSGSSSPESPDRTSFVLDIAVNATIKFSLNASAGGNTTSVYRGLPNTIIAGSVPSPRALFRITYLGN